MYQVGPASAAAEVRGQLSVWPFEVVVHTFDCRHDCKQAEMQIDFRGSAGWCSAELKLPFNRQASLYPTKVVLTVGGRTISPEPSAAACPESVIPFLHEMTRPQARALVAVAARSGSAGIVRWTFLGVAHTTRISIAGVQATATAIK